MSILAAWFATVAAVAAPPPEVPEGMRYDGPDTVRLDLLRTSRDGPRNKIYVQATLPDGRPGLFMLDTGAAISALSKDTAERLGLTVERDWGSVEGLGGRASLHRAVVPTLALGDAVVRDVEFAVDIPGVPDSAGMMPLDGILGNNVWSRFTLAIDYPRDQVTLYRPGTHALPKRAAPMHFDGHAVYTAITVETDSGVTARLPIQLDTGAHGLILSGPDAFPYQGSPGDEPWTEGLEPVLGIGAADTMPSNVFLRKTRHIPLHQIEMGGRVLDLDDRHAQWMNFEGSSGFGPTGMVGLAGHELFDGYVLWFDYPGGAWALARGGGPKRRLDGHVRLLDQDLERYGQDPQRGLARGRLLAGLDRLDEADEAIRDFLATSPPPEDASEARVLQAWIRRANGDLPGAWEALRPLSPADLVREGELVASVNGLALEGRAPEALTLADQAVATYTEAALGDDYEVIGGADALIARADALFALGRYEESRDAVLDAARLLENPDAHLLRRARIALALHDRLGAMAHIRRLLQLYPSNGQYLWFYATLLQADPERDTFRSDMSAALALLHAEDRPLDYLAHAFHLLGDQAQAERTLRAGLSEDCDTAEIRSDRDNCYAWYFAMGGIEPEQSLALIQRALAADPHRSDYLDTQAMVRLARGEVDLAYASALAAARLSPSEAYMLWQAERIRQLAEGAESSPDAQGLPSAGVQP